MKLKITFLIVFICWFSYSCELRNDVVACFTTDPESDFQARKMIDFYNCSEYANYYLWNFGDGVIVFDTNTTHIYKEAGTYTITLVAQKENFEDLDADSVITELDIAEKKSNSYTQTITVE